LQAALWVSHPYRGIYKIDAKSRRAQYYGEKDGLPSTLNNHLFSINKRILVATLQGIYEYNRTTNRFTAAEGYTHAFKGISLRYLKADNDNNLWFVSEKKLGVLDAASGSIYYFPELQRKLLSGFEHIYPLPGKQLLIGGEEGFFLLNYGNYKSKKTVPEVFIRSVGGKEKRDTLLYGGFGSAGLSGRGVQLSHRWTELTFDFSAAYTIQSPYLEYSYRLKGLDNNWSAWTSRTQKSYSQLQPGDYVFEVKVRNNLLAESAVVSYTFSVSPPWYSSYWARLLYALLLAAAVYAVLKLQARQMRARHAKKMASEQQKFEEQQKLQAYQHQLAIEKSERELVQLRNEKLESELAATAMNLVQKKEFLLKIREEINKLKQSGTRQVEATDLKKVLKDLTTEDKLDEEWEQFSRHFNHVHNNFLVTLKEKYPQLTAHDLKLCAYLRMNLSSKEIARLMSISIRGVEINRYRLRKKLPLETKESLFDFLLKLEKE
jgi:DNA-binding CsgD family transcriptional regulator